MTLTSTTCWADPLLTAERRELAWMLAQDANAFFGAATDDQVRAHTGSELDALHLGHGLMDCHGDAQELRLDVTERAGRAADDPLAVVCVIPGCTHDRGSHWDGTGACGFCGCQSFAGEQVPFATLAGAA